MTSREFSGAWYTDALPNGNYVATWRDGRIESNGSAVPPPPNGAILPLYVRLRNTAVVQFTGQEWQASDRALTWNQLNGWTVDDRVACGVSPCIYDNDGTLHVNVGCAVGSQGWRYVSADNTLVTGDATYSPTAQWTLWEWTQLEPDLVIGQGADGGCLVWDRGQMRYLIAESAGVCRFIRAVRDGENVSVAYWGETGVPSAAYWLTMTELRSLPLVPPPVPPVPPLPPEPSMDTLTSTNGQYRAIMQNDGNFVVYGPTGPLWASNTNQDAAGTPPVPPGPTPPNPPVYQDGRVGGSFYTALTCPWVDPKGYAQALANCGVGLTRLWLLDAWAVNGGEDAGQYPGFLPVKRTSDGRFDLRQWDPAYFDRLQVFAGALRDAKILPQFTLLELYTWAQRKQGMLWVPDANKGPYRSNVNGVRWGDPDDPTFYALPDDWLDEFIGHALEALGGFPFTIELANEMPEKDLHYRLRDCVRDHGYPGPVQVNRNEDTPGQYWNMKIGTEFQSLALHGMKTLDYLDVEYPEEAAAGRPTTFRDMWPMVDASRVTLSSDGCRKSTDVTDAYDYPALTEVAKDTLARGGSYEHQLACKLRIFTEGVFRLEDIEQFDGPFLRGLR